MYFDCHNKNLSSYKYNITLSWFTSCTYIIAFINVLSSVLVNASLWTILLKRTKYIIFFHRTYLKHNFQILYLEILRGNYYTHYAVIVLSNLRGSSNKNDLYTHLSRFLKRLYQYILLTNTNMMEQMYSEYTYIHNKCLWIKNYCFKNTDVLALLL